MKKRMWLVLLLLLLVFLIFYFQKDLTLKLPKKQSSLAFITLPENYAIEILADDLGPSRVSIPGPNKGVRQLAYRGGIIYATLPGRGEVIRLYDQDNDWVIEKEDVLISGLNNPHGISLYDDYVYIAEEDKVIRIKENKPAEIEQLVSLPEGGHWTRTIHIFNDSLFISIGSTCNVCYEEHPWRASIVQCDLDGQVCAVFASGLRNAVDFIQHDGIIWATDNGRDRLGNDVPPDEINLIEAGKDYGWPVCYGRQIHDTDFDKNIYVRNPCEDTEPSFVDLQAHSAALGLTFWDNELFVAYHGSWNRDPPTGYKLVRINLTTKEAEDFAVGWLDEQENVLGRLVDLLVVRDSLLVTDDVAGKIYRIRKKE